MSNQIKVQPIPGLSAELSVPGDKSISHRAAIFGGLAQGLSKIENFLPSEDCLNTLKAMEMLGAKATFPDGETLKSSVHIEGVAGKLKAPGKDIDCGNSGTGMRLLAGLLAAQPFDSTLIGDESLSSRPMGRIITPLSEMGANIEAKGPKKGCAPLHIKGQSLKGIHYEMPMASAQVKSAVLLAGLFAPGKTSVTQPALTRDHTERLGEQFQISTRTEENTITIFGGQVPVACDFSVPGDFSSAAFWITLAACIPGSYLKIKNLGLNPTRTALIGVLVRMGASISDYLTSSEGELVGDLEVRGRDLKGTEILPAEIPNLIDEIPVLSVAAAIASGTTVIRNASELRVKETDRIATVAAGLKAMGVRFEEFEDGLEIHGGEPLRAAEVDSQGDHRIAMAFAVAGLLTKSGTTTISGTQCIQTSYPNFEAHLQHMRKSH